jgi:hypothetical protein
LASNFGTQRDCAFFPVNVKALSEVSPDFRTASAGPAGLFKAPADQLPPPADTLIPRRHLPNRNFIAEVLD